MEITNNCLLKFSLEISLFIKAMTGVIVLYTITYQSHINKFNKLNNSQSSHSSQYDDYAMHCIKFQAGHKVIIVLSFLESLMSKKVM